MSTFEINGITFKSQTENKLLSEELLLIKDSEICEYKLALRFGGDGAVKQYSLSWELPQLDMIGFWSSKSSFAHNLTPDWNMRREESRTASGMPLISVFNKKNENRVSVALSDPLIPCNLLTGVVEENGTLLFKIELFSKICPKMSEYELIIRMDRRCVPLQTAIEDTALWWETLGFKKAYTPSSARLPMYSTWYSFHQNTIPDEIIAECKRAKELGMDTVIVDDGWQTEDNSRGYAFCGDWQISKTKIPDMKAFVDEIHALGMKFMIWFSVPFVGFESKNFERFKGMYLSTRPLSKTCVLDPRFKEVRSFLTDIYTSYVKEFGWDGLKLDFIDSFQESEESSHDYGKMDCISVEEGVRRLLDETCTELKKINPEFMIEFRQSYVGPVVTQYGNMIRVGDCPNDALVNRVHSLDLRLTCGSLAVHSDMIMWNKQDSVQSVAYQLLATMFCVPQISVRFDNISAEQATLLKNHLAFVRAHNDTLLNGKLTVCDVDADYTMAKAIGEGEGVTVLYQAVMARCECDTEYIFNSSGKDYILVEAESEAKYEAFDCLGNACGVGIIHTGVNKIPICDCGMVKISF